MIIFYLSENQSERLTFCAVEQARLEKNIYQLVFHGLFAIYLYWVTTHDAPQEWNARKIPIKQYFQ